MPELRKIEKALRGTAEAEEFLRTLPHKYYDENILHSIFISSRKAIPLRTMAHGATPHVTIPTSDTHLQRE